MKHFDKFNRLRLLFSTFSVIENCSKERGNF